MTTRAQIQPEMATNRCEHPAPDVHSDYVVLSKDSIMIRPASMNR